MRDINISTHNCTLTSNKLSELHPSYSATDNSWLPVLEQSDFQPPMGVRTKAEAGLNTVELVLDHPKRVLELRPYLDFSILRQAL